MPRNDTPTRLLIREQDEKNRLSKLRRKNANDAERKKLEGRVGHLLDQASNYQPAGATISPVQGAPAISAASQAALSTMLAPFPPAPPEMPAAVSLSASDRADSAMTAALSIMAATAPSAPPEMPAAASPSSSSSVDSVLGGLRSVVPASVKQESGLEAVREVSEVQQHQEKTWDHHEAAMVARFFEARVPGPLLALNLFYQKKAFDKQAAHELLVLGASNILKSKFPRTPYIRIGNTEYDSSTGGLWNLSSTSIWEHYRNGEQWNQAKWTPGGDLIIQKIQGQAILYLDFGDRSFSAGPIKLPEFASLLPVACTATCLRTRAMIDFEIIFLPDACMKVCFPTALLLAEDHGCRVLSDTIAEFSAVFVQSLG
ncbi:uncharacterized protein BDR25DRAFT_384342 [Lindgomyces ingoldianus]|uniref:Uncharacterized protein n=1 Tax=Lindgomyces ingoldianus TaxID=673940 RepID=A0ACB6R6N7_9PLEO|nr:uncharacterized protein BDR25DRAFT_384342 [Lindgomyces ingoldianus]KAF2474909.1 hypothetical protein BDR25DRAFT_384342 [Lindgomyces ingoldianus]